jgi:hypothetical protein
MDDATRGEPLDTALPEDTGQEPLARTDQATAMPLMPHGTPMTEAIGATRVWREPCCATTWHAQRTGTRVRGFRFAPPTATHR